MDLTGQTFNFWKVLKPTDNKKYYYDCECLKCHRIYSVYQSTLKNGNGKMCRACAGKIQSKRQQRVHEELIGKSFGRLTVIGWATDNKNRTVYTCTCSCGNQTTVGYTDLVTGHKTSCGCFKAEKSRESIYKTYEPLQKEKEKAYIEGSFVHALNAKTPKSNKTGVKGVSKTKEGKYRAYINLARKQYHLGIFDTLEEAKKAREAGEEEYYRPILEEYKRK